MDQDFIKLVASGETHIINIRQIVRVTKEVNTWVVHLTSGAPVVLKESEAELLLQRLPCIQT